MGEHQPYVTRRTALKSATGFGALAGFGGTVAGSDTVEVPVAIQDNQVMATREVDRDWWDHVLESRAIRDELEGSLSDSSAIASVSTTASDTELNGHTKRRLRVKIDENRLPDHVDPEISDIESQLDITIPDQYRRLDVELISVPYRKRYCNNAGDFNPIPGGVIMHPGENVDSYATFCCRVYHQGLQDYMMLITDHSQDYGDSVHQGDNLLGTPTGFRDGTLDYQLITRDNASLSLSCSVDTNGGSEELGGHATNLEALEEDNEDMFKTGCTTGYVTAEITDISGHEVTFDGDGAIGDSGAPWYYVEDFGYPMGERAVIVAMETHGPGSYPVHCPPAYNIPAGPTSTGTSGEAIVNDDSSIVFSGCSS